MSNHYSPLVEKCFIIKYSSYNSGTMVRWIGPHNSDLDFTLTADFGKLLWIFCYHYQIACPFIFEKKTRN